MGALETFFTAEYERRGECLPTSREGLVEWAWDSLGRFETAVQPPQGIQTVPGDGFVRHEWLLSSVRGLEHRAYFLTPPGPGPFPGVLALHGHGYGPEEMVGLGPESGHHHFALALVRRGFAVLVPGVLGFGDRRFEDDRQTDSWSCQRMAGQLLLQGKTLAGLRVAEALGAFEVLRGLPQTQGRGVGLAGFSGGALIALWTALIGGSDATVLMGFPNTFRHSLLAVSHCLDNFIPRTLCATELPGLLGRLAPQPLFLESGRDDPIFPEPGFRQAVVEVEEAYTKARVPDRLAWDLFPGLHEVSGRLSFPWLSQVLGAESGPRP